MSGSRGGCFWACFFLSRVYRITHIETRASCCIYSILRYILTLTHPLFLSSKSSPPPIRLCRPLSNDGRTANAIISFLCVYVYMYVCLCADSFWAPRGSEVRTSAISIVVSLSSDVVSSGNSTSVRVALPPQPIGLSFFLPPHRHSRHRDSVSGRERSGYLHRHPVVLLYRIIGRQSSREHIPVWSGIQASVEAAAATS